ncbi:hypothetical protein HaLaN_23352, partial [Haematococcus lacustris]
IWAPGPRVILAFAPRIARTHTAALPLPAQGGAGQDAPWERGGGGGEAAGAGGAAARPGHCSQADGPEGPAAGRQHLPAGVTLAQPPGGLGAGCPVCSAGCDEVCVCCCTVKSGMGIAMQACKHAQDQQSVA